VKRVRYSGGEFEGVRDVRLAFHAWEVPRARAAVVVVHGLGEHGRRYADLAERFATNGFSTFAYDQRGHGMSEGRRGHVARFRHFVQDLERFRRTVEGLVDFGTPLFLLGHSMGGLVALRHLEEYDAAFHGSIIVSPWLATAVPIPRWKTLAANTIEHLLPAFPLRSGLDPDHLSRDPNVVQAYRDDPLVHDRITPRLFNDASRAMGLAMQRGEKLRTPLLFLLAGQDRIVSTLRSNAFARALPARDVTIRIREDDYHEILNEPGRAIAIQEIRDWIAARIPAAAHAR